MATILNIDTAIESASLCLAKDTQSLQFAMNDRKKDHASWLHPAIAKLMSEASLNMHELEAIAVSAGPGSYTGLRIGLSTAKGLCFALGTPLITINTLEMMAYAAREISADLLCPMIDARRMEVFSAVYDRDLKEIIKPQAIMVNPDSFATLLESRKVLFFGNGSEKLKKIIRHPNAQFSAVTATAADLAWLSEECFQRKLFADLAYAEPLYLKEFYSVAR